MSLRPAQPIRLHTFALSGHAHRVDLMLSLLGLPYERIAVDLKGGAHKREPYLSLNPFGEVPAIEDGEVVLADSNAILVYLALRYDADRRWLPVDAVAQARVQRWLSVAAGELRHGIARARWTAGFMRQPVPAEVLAVGSRLLGLIEQQLADHDWLAGAQPTLADVAMYSYTAKAPEGGLSLDPHPRLRAWLTQVEALPGFVAMPALPVAAA